jgi:hypothetical protein
MKITPTIFIWILLVVACQPREEKPIPNVTPAQKNNSELSADFCIVRLDLNSFPNKSDSRKFNWTINNQEIVIDSITEFNIKVYEGFDTIHFRNPREQSDDLILCDLEKGGKYLIYFNPCCSAFNFEKVKMPSDTVSEKKSVEFHLTSDDKKRRLIGGLGRTAAFLKPQQGVVLTGDYWASAMEPQRYRIFVQDFAIPKKDSAILAIVVDPVTQKEICKSKSIDKKLVNFQYFFLNNDKLKITIDPMKDSIRIDRLK